MMRLYEHGGKLFQVKREIPHHNFIKNGQISLEFVKAWRDWLGVDHVLKTQTHYLFVVNVDDIEFEEVSNE
ncbi:hypothetical protein OAC50_00520 [bacterium]|jgi:hypothetical protein|nr:hypothetical protein [bacterium]|tara:strand:+ start:94 stop:306 length:213 start_codon:yes stop_codon:yes gene_type:complete